MVKEGGRIVEEGAKGGDCKQLTFFFFILSSLYRENVECRM